jgi:hypothetical protein
MKATTSSAKSTKAKFSFSEIFEHESQEVKDVYNALTTFDTKSATNHEIRLKLGVFTGAGYDTNDIDQGKRIRRILNHLIAIRFASVDKSTKKGENQKEFLYKSLDVLSKK